MSDPTKEKGKVEKEPRDIKKTPEYRKFKAFLRKVMKAPPMPNIKRHSAKQSPIPDV